MHRGELQHGAWGVVPERRRLLVRVPPQLQVSQGLAVFVLLLSQSAFCEAMCVLPPHQSDWGECQRSVLAPSACMQLFACILGIFMPSWHFSQGCVFCTAAGGFLQRRFGSRAESGVRIPAAAMSSDVYLHIGPSNGPSLSFPVTPGVRATVYTTWPCQSRPPTW